MPKFCWGHAAPPRGAESKISSGWSWSQGPAESIEMVHVSESLKILKTRFNKKLLISEEWNMDKQEQVKSTFDDLGNRVTVTVPPQVNVLNEATGCKVPVVLPPQPKQTPVLHINELTKKLEALTLVINTIQESQEVSGSLESLGKRPRCWNI
ncbi:hypothetical protein BT96DRAFT_948655 [Gymnopus androsaceus JB14]|uniref:Uncharacterized protein n=1 Tax=Gymnopus androsaceus JB14 TaxID=1447944 RepID=A0A6A4GPB8_9AGAR|nr:hypothetical protein BT96DRAFT_948655 [Gymnopus androsaceus JB14]